MPARGTVIRATNLVGFSRGNSRRFALLPVGGQMSCVPSYVTVAHCILGTYVSHVRT
jgi:hypothetical protein